MRKPGSKSIIYKGKYLFVLTLHCQRFFFKERFITQTLYTGVQR